MNKLFNQLSLYNHKCSTVLINIDKKISWNEMIKNLKCEINFLWVAVSVGWFVVDDLVCFPVDGSDSWFCGFVCLFVLVWMRTLEKLWTGEEMRLLMSRLVFWATFQNRLSAHWGYLTSISTERCTSAVMLVFSSSPQLISCPIWTCWAAWSWASSSLSSGETAALLSRCSRFPGQTH